MHPVFIFLSGTLPFLSVPGLDNDVVHFVWPHAPSLLPVHLFHIADKMRTGGGGHVIVGVRRGGHFVKKGNCFEYCWEWEGGVRRLVGGRGEGTSNKRKGS